jgi:hypothetical protein
MHLIRIDRDPSGRQLRLFGMLWLAFFGVAGAVMLVRGGPSAAAVGLIAAAALVPAIGCLSPRFLRWVYLGMAYLAFPIGFVVSHVLMALIYFAVLTPIGLAMRLVGYDPLHRRFDPGADTYWIPREQRDEAKQYFRQF